MEALEDTWENLQKIIEVCRFYFVFFFSIKIQQVANAIILNISYKWLEVDLVSLLGLGLNYYTTFEPWR